MAQSVIYREETQEYFSGRYRYCNDTFPGWTTHLHMARVLPSNECTKEADELTRTYHEKFTTIPIEITIKE